jgi:mannose-6-phosphate isomerase
MAENPPKFDPSNFKNEPYVKRIEKPWGFELHWVPADAPYMGKVLHIDEGHQFSLQFHDEKRESWYIISGRALLIWDNNKGELVETELEPRKGYNLSVGQRHRIRAITTCEIIEASTAEIGTTWRLEDDYSRPNETPEQRAKRDRGEVI